MLHSFISIVVSLPSPTPTFTGIEEDENNNNYNTEIDEEDEGPEVFCKTPPDDALPPRTFLFQEDTDWSAAEVTRPAKKVSILSTTLSRSRPVRSCRERKFAKVINSRQKYFGGIYQ